MLYARRMALQPIFIDVYADDLDGSPAWPAAAADPQVAGAILKATQGLYYSDPSWLATNWRAIHAVDRSVGTDWFCGAYHYLDAAANGDTQAAFFLQNLEAAGGLGVLDLWAIVDVESADNTGASAQQFIDATSAFAAGIQSRTGRSTMLYGGEAMRSLGIKSRMGCSWLWTASYTSTLPKSEIHEMGWTEARLWGWQYQGTGCPGELAGYPTSIPGFAGTGDVDLTVMVMWGGLPALRTALVATP
jgi:GH25 family lysozyme M1 (1,4-beta-N-acetylmuramidase)